MRKFDRAQGGFTGSPVVLAAYVCFICLTPQLTMMLAMPADHAAVLSLLGAPCWGYDAWTPATAPLWLSHMVQASPDNALNLLMIIDTKNCLEAASYGSGES